MSQPILSVLILVGILAGLIHLWYKLPAATRSAILGWVIVLLAVANVVIWILDGRISFPPAGDY